MKKVFRIIILIFGIGIMVFSGNKLWNIYSEYAKGAKLYDDYGDRFVEVEVVESEVIKIDFDALFTENKDVVGWIYSEGTPINYPIVQSSDNNYYLRRTLDDNYNISGTIFMDYRNDSDLTDYNTIIYGHNMKNGTMFGTLDEYMKQEYYDEHPVIHYITPEQNYEIELITGYVTDARSNTYNIPETIEEQSELSQDMISQSRFKTNSYFEEGDKIITLSTCAYDFYGARYVVIGRVKPVP